MGYTEAYTEAYTDVSFVTTDASFGTPSDMTFNANQYTFYKSVEKNLNALSQTSNENVKQIQINTYYYKRYKAENQLLYFIMIVLLFVIIITLIKKNYPFLDDLAYSIIIGSILGLSIIYIVYSLWIIMNKDSSNYDENEYSYSTNNITSGPDRSNTLNDSCLDSIIPDVPIQTVNTDKLMSSLFE
uniref:Uncharacterized protein n=1 Tax=viral metagenome TaxID=1070528 RepID=A0A6C0D1K9_9ZZZZ